ncbi:MAG: hypothetical protein IKL10_04655 [Clostridia bacterium]|nr:hypothetical protein [Clostridia bacterium]
MAGTINSVKALINGQEYTLTLNSSTGKYEAQGIAPSGSSFNLEGGYYPIEVTATYVTGTTSVVNDKTEGVVGEGCRMCVREKVKPTAIINYPTQGQYITTELQKIEFTVLDNTSQESGFSGINIDSIVVNITGGSLNEPVVIRGSKSLEVTPIEGGYECILVPSEPIPDGVYTVSLDVSDNDGNAAVTAVVTATIDTAPPELSVISPAEGLNTSNNVITVAGNTSDVTSAPVKVSVNINGEDKGTIPVNDDGSFSKDFMLTFSGNQVIVITTTDSAGKASSVTRNIYFSADVPTIKSVIITPNPVDGGTTFTITVEVE